MNLTKCLAMSSSRVEIKKLTIMSTDIFVVDTPFLIAKLEEEAAKEEPRKLRYVLRDLAVAENAFAYEYTGYLSNIHSVKAYFDANLDMLESQNSIHFLHQTKKFIQKLKMKSQHTIQTLQKLSFHNLHLVRLYEEKLRTQ